MAGSCGRSSRPWPARRPDVWAEPVGAVLAVEPGQECQADRRIDFGEQTHSAGEDAVEVFAQLVGHGRRGDRRDPCGRGSSSQRDGGRAIGGQRSQPDAVGAQRVGQHEGVEPVVFVAGRAVAAAQVLDLVGADDDHGDPGVEQRVDHRPVGAFDGHLLDTVLGEQVEQAAQSRMRCARRSAQDLAYLGRRPPHTA